MLRTFTVNQSDPNYDHLRALDIEFFYITNIDDLPYHIFDARQGQTSRVLHDVYLYGSPRQTDYLIRFIPLHGSVKHDDADFLFTAGQMSAAFASDRETWYVFQKELQARPTVFVGYGLRDAGVLQALEGAGRKTVSNRWILLRKDDPAAIALYKSLGFHILIGDVRDFLGYVGSLPKPAGAAPVRRRKLTGEVPLSAEAAQRPIRNFFLGAEPEWSDAYSTQVSRR